MYLFKYVTLKNLIPFRFLSSKLVVRLGWNFFFYTIPKSTEYLPLYSHIYTK